MPTDTFNYTGAQVSWTVPYGVSKIVLDVQGARGGGGFGGNGGRVQCELAVSRAQVLYLEVGEHPAGRVGGWSNGFGTGGDGGVDNDTGQLRHGYGGGGRTTVKSQSTNAGHYVIAGAGGGSTYPWQGGNKRAGLGGGLTATGALDMDTASGCQRLAGGGSQTAGGVSGLPMTTGTTADGQTGGAGVGGHAGSINWYSNEPGGGGGGGYYGGGGGHDMYGPSTGGGYYYGGGSGGGGSSWAGNGVTGVVHTQGHNGGHGVIVITYVIVLPSIVL